MKDYCQKITWSVNKRIYNFELGMYYREYKKFFDFCLQASGNYGYQGKTWVLP